MTILAHQGEELLFLLPVLVFFIARRIASGRGRHDGPEAEDTDHGARPS